MTLDEFKEQYNFAPYDVDEFTEIIEELDPEKLGSCSEVEEYELCLQLVEQAKKYQDARRNFLRTFRSLNLEFG